MDDGLAQKWVAATVVKMAVHWIVMLAVSMVVMLAAQRAEKVETSAALRAVQMVLRLVES